MNRLLPLAVVPILALAACGGDDDSPKPEPKPKNHEAVASEVSTTPDWEWTVVQTPEGPLECMYASTGYKSGGPSCNWEKFNQGRAGAGNE